VKLRSDFTAMYLCCF